MSRITSICILATVVLSFSSHDLNAQTPDVELVESGPLIPNSNSPFFLVFRKSWNDSSESKVMDLLVNGRNSIQLLFNERLNQLPNELSAKLENALKSGSINPRQFIVLDFSKWTEGSLMVLEDIAVNPSKYIAFGSFNSVLYNRLPGQIRFVELNNYESIDYNALEYFMLGIRRWGYEAEKAEIRKKVSLDSTISRSHRGLFQIGLDYGQYFLSGKNDNDKAKFQIAESSSLFGLSIGYGITNKLIIQTGLSLSAQLPNRDEQVATFSSLRDELTFSSQSHNQLILSGSLGIKYYFNIGKLSLYGILNYEVTDINLINFKVFKNQHGEIRDRFSTTSRSVQGVSSGLGIEFRLAPRLYFDIQFKYLRSQPFNDPVNGVERFNTLTGNMGFKVKLGTPKR